MKYKKIMILLVLAVFLLGIAGVSASEIDNMIASEDIDSMELSADNDMAEDNLQTHEENEELTLTDNDDTLSVKNDTEILGANTGTYSGLSTEIGSGGNIELQHDYYTYDTGDTISISVADSVIDGKGAVIDMIGSNICAFHVSASGVTIKNLTIKNAKYAGSGGAILFTSSATSGTVTNCNFTNNTATNDGGAVYFSSDGEVTKCSFANNTAKMGNAIYINSNHGTISDCDFTNNLLTKGAIHSVTGDITFSNNILDVNDVVLCRNFTEIQKLIDRANDGDEITIDGLYAGFGIPIRITKSLTLIGQNNATLDAKKLSKILYITANNVIIKNIQFTNGYAENEGAVYFYSAGSVENCNFTNNEVTGEKSSGGAIYFNGAGNVINSIFTANRATRNGGAIYVEAQSINNNFSSQFYNNYAGQSGGAIFFHNLVQNNNFLCIFKDNYAGYGGGIFFSKNANANRFSSDFINNTAKSCGGAMFFYSTTDKNNFTGCFINNSALGQIDPANGNGGAITFKNVSTNSIFTCDFSNNTASLNGGGVNYRETPKNIIFNANFINNSAQRGGGVNFFNTFEDVIFNGEFIGNSAENGGALAAGYGTIGDISFKNNHANNGGAVYLAGSGSTVNCNFTNNRATHNGGAVYISEKCNVVNCSFADNSAAHDAGAVYSKFGAVENCNFTGNNASNDGGAVSLSYPSNVANCHFADNSAKNGGALYFLNDDDNVINCSFVANEATSRGGAVFFMTPRQVNATNCYFEGNSAPEGGAIFCYTWAVTADSVILKTDSDTTNNTLILSPKLNVYDFYSVYGSGENLTFNLTTHGSMPITNGNISMIIYFKDNDRGAVNYTCLSGKDWTVDLPVGSYYAFINTEYKEFEPIIRTIEITMPNVQFYINVTSVTTNSKTMNITAKSNIPKNLIWDGKLLFILSNGTQIDAIYGANGTWWAEHTFDDYGEYKINATYVGLDNVTVNNGTITINNINSTITLDNIVLDYGESENVTVTTTGATGIKANINGTDVTVINNFTIQISGLKAGNHTLSVTTIPDENHNPVTVTSKITVNKVESTLTVDDIEFDYNGEGSGDVSFTGASEVIANVVNQSKAVVSVSGNKISVSGLAAGTYTLNVTTVPDENHTAVTETATITVNKINSTLTLGDVELDYGDSINVTVATEGATGITAKIDGVNVTVSNYTISISGLGAGNYTLTVTTIPDKNHNPVTKEVNITVNKLSTEIILANETLDLKVGDEVPVLANLTPAGAGNLTFTSSNEDLVFVEDNVTIVANSQGQAIITVSFAGNENYTAAENKTITVNVALNDASVSVENDTLNLKVDETSAINATIEPDTIMLHIKYTSSDESVVTVDKNGIVTAVGEGRAIITLEVGDDEIYAKNSTTVTVTVSKINTTADVSIPENITVGDNSTVNVILPADATGNVTVKVDGEVVDTVPVKDGNADVTIPSMSAGNHTVEIAYSGDGKYNPINETKEISVSKKDTTLEIIIPSDMRFGDDATIDVKLPGDATGNVTLTVDGEVVDTVPVSNGTASVKLPALGAGKHTVEVTYSGDDKYKPASKASTINVKKLSTKLSAGDVKVTYSVNKYLLITLKDGEGNPLDGVKITVNLNGAKVYTTDSNGQVKIIVGKLVPKTYTAKIAFAGNNKYLGSTASAKVVVQKANVRITALNKVYKFSVKVKLYPVILKDFTGKVLKNVVVTLKVNGKTYSAKTDANGKAIFKITQLTKKGTYNAVITFKGNSYYNKVVKKATIKVNSVR